MAKNKRIEWADAVFPHIPSSDGDEPVSSSALCAATGLTSRQVRHAVAELRELFKDDAAPLVSGPRGYLFTFDGAKVGAYRHLTAKSAHTTIRRLYIGAIKRYLSSLPVQDKGAKLISKQFARVLEDLGELIGAGSA